MEDLGWEIDDATLTQVHVQALDEVVSVNSFFTVAVFIGLAFATPSNSHNTLVDSCPGHVDLPKFLLVFEVVSFSCYLLSSLIAQGLKLLIVLLNSNKKHEAVSTGLNPKALRAVMLITAVGTIIGTIFLTLSIAILVQMQLGLLTCSSSSWSKWGVFPMVAMVSTGLISFITIVLYAFII